MTPSYLMFPAVLVHLRSGKAEQAMKAQTEIEGRKDFREYALALGELRRLEVSVSN